MQVMDEQVLLTEIVENSRLTKAKRFVGFGA